MSTRRRTLTWKFYSTSDGRSVDWDTSGLQNIVEPPEPLYEENPDLPEGKIKQVDWAVDGADVTVTRTVTRDGQRAAQRHLHHPLPALGGRLPVRPGHRDLPKASKSIGRRQTDLGVEPYGKDD